MFCKDEVEFKVKETGFITDLTDDMSPGSPLAASSNTNPGNNNKQQNQNNDKQQSTNNKKNNQMTSGTNQTNSRAKPIPSRITRTVNEGISVIEQRKNISYLHRCEVTPPPQEKMPQTLKQVTLRKSDSKKASANHPVKFAPFTDPNIYSYPKGIPKSFLMKPSEQTPEPYSQFANKNLNPQQNVQPNTFDWQAGNVPDINPTWPTQTAAPVWTNADGQPLFVNTETETDHPQAYSPSDVYTDNLASISQNDEDELDPNTLELGSGEKRQSAFDRLGPVSQPKKPKLTINLLCNKEQPVREVVDETNEEPKEKYIPVHLREDILSSTDETVVKFRELWPWKKTVANIKAVTARSSKSVMLMEMEQMDEHYLKENVFFQITVKGYPPKWTKENVLDAILDAIKLKGFTPCFIEFTPQECNFLVIKSRPGLLAIHRAGFCIRKDDVEMNITIALTTLSLKHIEFIPRLILRKRLYIAYDGEKCLDLSNFTRKEDISHFIYYPLNQSPNQMELVQLQTCVEWSRLTELILSHNRITSIDGFNLAVTSPKLKHLDLSYNNIPSIMALIRIRDLSLRSIKLEGNPLCHDYTDPGQYVKVLKTMFSSLQEIDDVPIKMKGEMPSFKKNYCPEDAKGIIEKFLEVYFPLLDSTDHNRAGIEELYHEKASMTITYRFKLRYGPIYRTCRSLFLHSRVMDEGDTDAVNGASAIASLIDEWPVLKHDPSTFTIDVLQHDDWMTIFKVAGVLQLPSENLNDDHLLAFSRTFVLHSYDGCEYKITNEMVYWDKPTPEYANNAFQITMVKPKKLSLTLESPPDEDLKQKLLEIFMRLTDLSLTASKRCLEQKDWNLKMALDYFMKLLKLDDLEILTK
ncbi:unnamed protein product [Diatraea saccharalis]|uniref:NTF2 domain-containing protein n=1 Tax=Diatraea saccharalis TaxID=40085 RepID=A0A9N9R2J7_9NEOP|nr:unnamed protein product [Diatraea saccharalis]